MSFVSQGLGGPEGNPGPKGVNVRTAVVSWFPVPTMSELLHHLAESHRNREIKEREINREC